jgi:PAS domain S-box-containing protein
MAGNPAGNIPFRIAESLYRSFFENALDGLAFCEMVFDAESMPVGWRYIQVNDAFEKLTGLTNATKGEVSTVLQSFDTPPSELIDIYTRVSMGGGPERFETYAEPFKRWLHVSVYSPKRTFFVATFQNITDRKQIEIDLEHAKIAAQNVLEDLQIEKDTLAHEKAKDEAMLASIGDGVIIVDAEGNITFWNQSAQDLLGWEDGEVVGKSFFDTVCMEDEKGERVPVDARPMTRALTLGAATTTTTHDSSYYYVRKNKTRFPAAAMVTPVILEGKVIGSIEVFRNIVKEKEIDRAKTEFVSLASHQLRTPLSSVRWYVDMLLDGDAGPLNAKQTQYLEEVQHGNLRMIELVNMLLHVSRLELGMATVQLESVNVARAITEVLQDMEPLWRKQGVRVEVHIPQELPSCISDATFVRIVIENLLSNAIKYTTEHGTVRVSAQEVSAGAHFHARVARVESIGIAISDTGIGIPDESQDNIFQKLFRAENAQEIDANGTGLGLYLTRLVLGHLKGEVWFTSREGEGASFYILIPSAGVAYNERRYNTDLV